MAGSNWMLYRPTQRHAFSPARQVGNPFGSATAATFEINTVDDSIDTSNDIFKISTTSDSLFGQPTGRTDLQELKNDLGTSVEFSDEDDDVRRTAEQFDTTLNFAEANDVKAPPRRLPERRRAPDPPVGLPDPADHHVRHFNPQPLFGSRRTTPVPTDHRQTPITVEIPLSDPYDPEVKSEPQTSPTLADQITAKSKLLRSPYVYRDGSPEARKLTYKVVKGPAPLPPSAPVEQTSSRSPSLNRVIYRNPEKRPAPQPPSIYEHEFWKSVEEEAMRPLSAYNGVEAKVRRRQSKDSRRRFSIRSYSGSNNVNMNLTFREKMSRFFGRSGRSKIRSRASFSRSSSPDSNVKYFSNRNTLQSFTYLQSKTYLPQNGEVMQERRVDPARPQGSEPPVQRAWARSTYSNYDSQRRRPFSDVKRYSLQYNESYGY